MKKKESDNIDTHVSAHKAAAARRIAANPNVFKEMGLKGGLKSTGYKVLSKPVKQSTMGGRKVAQYDSIHRAADATGIPVPSIHANLKGRMVHAGGFKWEYIPK